MKQKTIRKICKGKIEDWARTLEKDGAEDLAKIVRENSIITGGAITSMLLNEDVNDFDVYFRTREATIAVAEYYVQKFKDSNKKWINKKVGEFGIRTDDPERVYLYIKSAGVAGADNSEDTEDIPVALGADGEDMDKHTDDLPYQYFEGTDGDEAGEFLDSVVSYSKANQEKRYNPIFMSDNAITLTNKTQLVIRFYGEPEEIHDNYDYVHCMNYYTSWDNHVELRKDALLCIMNKELKYVGSLYPICSVIRMRKFISRGWTISAGQILKMCLQISALDLQNIVILKSQLVGVDVAYFDELIGILKGDEKITDSGSLKEIDQTYISELIDKIFD